MELADLFFTEVTHNVVFIGGTGTGKSHLATALGVSGITRACQGVAFHSIAIAKQSMEKAKTSTGLKVTVDILNGVYETGRKRAADFLQTMRTAFDEHLPRWNYRAIPKAN